MNLRTALSLLGIFVMAFVITGCGSSGDNKSGGTKRGSSDSAQKNPAKVAAAKSAVKLLQDALDECAASNGGVYESCDAVYLAKKDARYAAVIAPTVGGHEGTCTFETTGSCVEALIVTGDNYVITATAATRPELTAFRQANTSGDLEKTCKPKSDSCPDGTW